MSESQMNNLYDLLKGNIKNLLKANNATELEQQFELARKRLNTLYVERYNDFCRLEEWE